jgi:hypothetical protein
MRGLSFRSAALGCTVVLACGPSVTWTPRAPGASRISQPSRERDCTFDVLRGGSTRTYHELGVLEIEAFAVRALPRDEATFRRVVSEEVCRVGGDAVVPGVTGTGRFVLATVVDYDDASATGSSGSQPLKPEEQPPNSSTQPSGHHEGHPAEERAAW